MGDGRIASSQSHEARAVSSIRGLSCSADNDGSCQDLLEVQIPPGAKTGPVTFTNPRGTATAPYVYIVPWGGNGISLHGSEPMSALAFTI
jgi:hypothetical protein